MLTVPAVLRHQAEARGDQPLLICDDERLTYAEAERRSAHLAWHLLAMGAGKGTHVGVLYPNGAAFVVAMFAAARLGATVVPFSTFSTAPELHQQLVSSDTEILLTAASYRSHDYVARLAEILGGDGFRTGSRFFNGATPLLRHVLVDFEPSTAAHADTRLAAHDDTRLAAHDDTRLAAVEDDVDPGDVLAIVYTSGSTSLPKGVVHTHESLLAHQVTLNEIRGMTERDRQFCNSPFFWIGGVAISILAPLVSGATLVCSNAVDAAQTLDLIEAEKPTCTNGFVGGIAHLARHPSISARDLSSVRRGTLYPIMAPDVRPEDPELRHFMLGMTEAGSVITASDDPDDQPEARRGSHGTPIPGIETKVIDPDTGESLDAPAAGELCIRGPYVMQRYYKRSREECFDVDGWFHTGDLIRTDADGFVYFVGRRGSMIKSAGANVAPAEVEKAIAKVTDGLASYVVGLPDLQRGQVVAAVVTVDHGRDFDEPAVRAALRNELSSYKIPRRFVVMPSAQIPMMSSGKVDMQRLLTVFDV